MKIASVHIKSSRSFEDAIVPLNDYTCLVGPNGAGKSTILTALNVFFRESENLSIDLSQLDSSCSSQPSFGSPRFPIMVCQIIVPSLLLRRS